MTNLNGFLKKILFISSISILTLFISTTDLSANSLTVQYDIEHTVTQSTVDTNIYLTISSSTSKVITFFNTTLLDTEISPIVFYKGTQLETTIQNDTRSTQLAINVDNKMVTPDTPLELQIQYSKPSDISGNMIFLKSGITDATLKKITVVYPQTYGEPSWVSNPMDSIETKGNNYQLSISAPISTNLKIYWGEEISYGFNIQQNYNNSSTSENQNVDVIVPPDTDTQRVYFENISPIPDYAFKDENGNYIFRYSLAPESNIMIKIDGYIKNINYDSDEEPVFQKASGYWTVQDTKEITRLKTYLKEQGLDLTEKYTLDDIEKDEDKELLYKKIYEYIVTILEPSSTPNLFESNARLGANQTLIARTSSSPEDYSDALIALYKNFNIPTRMIIGYISEISQYQEDGMYHIWAEYYNTVQKRWVPVDPFLEDFKGVNLYDREFSDHITLLSREYSPVSPKLTFFTPNDFVLSINQNPVEESKDVDITFSTTPSKIYEPYILGKLDITNNSNIVLTSYDITDGNLTLSKYVDTISSYDGIIVPGQNVTVNINIPKNDISQESIFSTVSLLNREGVVYEKLIETNVSLVTPLYFKILSKLVSALIFTIIFVGIYLTIKKLKYRNG